MINFYKIKEDIKKKGWSGPWNFFSKDEIDNLLIRFIEIYKNSLKFPEINDYVEKIKLSSIKNLETKPSPTLFYKTVQDFAKNNIKIYNFFYYYFNNKEIELSDFTDFRMNFPNLNNIEATGWHQDIETFYTVITEDFKKNSLAMWISLTGSTKNNGVEFASGSQKKNIIYNTTFLDKKKKIEEIIDIKKNEIKLESFESKPGDIILIDPFVLHRSAFKNFDFLRCSIDVRYVENKKTLNPRIESYYTKLMRYKNILTLSKLKKKLRMSLKKVLLKIENKLIRFLNLLLKFTNYEISQKYVNFFLIEDFKYFSNKCSVGKTPQGEIAAKSIVKFIKEKKLLNLDLLDICCGTGIVGLTVFNLLKNTEYKLNSLTLADINIFNIDSIKKTLILNNYEKEKINCLLSDSLNHLDPSIKFDLIVSNPPHIEKKKQSLENDNLSADDLGTYDYKFAFHENFYSISHKYLKSNGEIWFFENGVDAAEDDFLKFINLNKKLNYYKKSIDCFDSRFFWMFSKLK